MSDRKPGEPEILVTVERVVCAAHGEHFRAPWPSGFPVFAVEMLQAALASDAMQDAARAMGGENAEGKLEVAYINLVLERRPCCYFVDRDTIRRLMLDSGIGKIGTCNVRGRSGIGGPYDVSLPMGTTTYPHLCFECGLDAGERLHRAHPKGPGTR